MSSERTAEAFVNSKKIHENNYKLELLFLSRNAGFLNLKFHYV
jgi:hypothetical protein